MITVVLPVYNGGALFRKCIGSLAQQDAKGAFDVVVLDNCSTDGSLESLDLLPNEVPRRVFRSETPQGIEGNWGRIANLSDLRPFMTIVGHDDTLDPNFIGTAIAALNSEPNTRLLFTHFRLIDAQDRVLRACRPMGSRESAGQFLAGRLAGIRDSFGTGYVMRSADYREIGGVPAYPKLIYADDALWLQLARRSGIRILDDECFSYRLHPSSTSQIHDSAIILHALANYVTLLESLSKEDMDVRRALLRYGSDFIEGMAAQWMLEEVNGACRANELARPEVLDGWRHLRHRVLVLADRQDAPARSDELDLALWANQYSASRRVWSIMIARRIMRKVATSLSRWRSSAAPTQR